MICISRLIAIRVICAHRLIVIYVVCNRLILIQVICTVSEDHFIIDVMSLKVNFSAVLFYCGTIVLETAVDY